MRQVGRAWNIDILCWLGDAGDT